MARGKKSAPTEQTQRQEEHDAHRRDDVGEAQFSSERARSEQIDRINEASFQAPSASAHGEISQPKSSGGKVIVACKLNVREIELQITRLEEKWENTQTGPRKIKEPVRVGPVVRIRGTSYPRGTPPVGFPPPPVIVHNAALNFDIDEDFWNEWLQANKLNPIVMNGMLFAHREVDFVKDRARDEKDTLSGLEPLNPKGDPRAPRSTRADLTNVETEESRKANMERLNQLQG